ncbi:hypothetical protein HMSSN139_15330 [Paenibacillus sp. HMSSN-139]|nr:hypothetical protein HMSSN139_15330 [Paenibacillus sp. HMSSN-139]
MKTSLELEQRLSEPSDRLVRDLTQLDGDVLILGVGGKWARAWRNSLPGAWLPQGKRKGHRRLPVRLRHAAGGAGGRGHPHHFGGFAG